MNEYHYENVNHLREIETSRNVEQMNEFAAKGFFPLVKKIERNPEIISKFSVLQNPETGEVLRIGDFRQRYRDSYSHFKEVIPFTRYYPYNYELPFAAYILPPDLKIGERVFLKDLIPDIVGSTWNQGDVYRLEYCEAVWNGNDFEIQFDEETDIEHFIG